MRLFFEAHMDSVAPTTGTHVMEKDGVLYSDGTTTLGGDDKSGVAAVLEAMQCIIENELPHGDIQVCFTIGEETGSYGVRYMDKTMIRADAGYCMDCGGHPGAIFNASPKANQRHHAGCRRTARFACIRTNRCRDNLKCGHD